ncbi:MAG: alanine--glyoxylate aminotransferase family protein [Armatimonadetes bacterium]|nr:alanine--glyoxylate aminotransferase family protein [Armatimonadota bacterium]
MNEDLLIMIPGPTGLPPEVREALARPQMGHRTPEFAELIADCTAGLQYLFRTTNDLLILTASGTGGMEAAVTNFLSPGDPVLAVSVGNFGERLGAIAETFGADVTWIKSEWGEPADVDLVGRTLAAGTWKALLFTQNETSTSITNPVEELSALARQAGALTIVDAISGMGGTPVLTDEWGLDVVVAGSQKALMLPPGLAFVSVSEKAWLASETATMPRFYFDLKKAKASLEKGQTPYTPNTSLFVALQASLNLIRAKGIENVWRRHAECAQIIRDGVARLGLKPFGDRRYASNVVTAFCPPEGVDPKAIIGHMREKHNILITGAQGAYRGRFLRIGHLGTIDRGQCERVLAALEETLKAART